MHLLVIKRVIPDPTPFFELHEKGVRSGRSRDYPYAKVAIIECSAQKKSSARCNSTPYMCVTFLRALHGHLFQREAFPACIQREAQFAAFAGFWGQCVSQRL